MNKWQKLCIQINPLIKRDVAEEVYHEQFVSYLQTIFNWDEKNIKVEEPVRMGSTDKYADIVLEGNGFGIVIEMKKPGVVLGDKEASQLSSYMRILGKRYGLLVGNKIKVFYDYDKDSSATTEIASFDFDVDNSEGSAFCEILERSNCSNESLKEYASEKLNRLEATKEFEQLKKELIANNGEKIKEIVKNKLVSEGHEEKYVLDILKDIVVAFSAPAGGEMQPGLIKDGNEMPNVPSASIKIKGVDVPLYKNSNETIQDFVKETLRLMFENKLIPDSEINNMLDTKYCKQIFGLGFPIIQNDENKLTDNAKNPRYWAKKIFGQYYACSQWYNKPKYQNKLADWIKKINSLNKIP
jgi:hypothetical protein